MRFGRRLAIVESEDPVTFDRWARVMYDDGAVNAAPGRNLTNILTVREEP